MTQLSSGISEWRDLTSAAALGSGAGFRRSEFSDSVDEESSRRVICRRRASGEPTEPIEQGDCARSFDRSAAIISEATRNWGVLDERNEDMEVSSSALEAVCESDRCKCELPVTNTRLLHELAWLTLRKDRQGGGHDRELKKYFNHKILKILKKD